MLALSPGLRELGAELLKLLAAEPGAYLREPVLFFFLDVMGDFDNLSGSLRFLLDVILSQRLAWAPG